MVPWRKKVEGDVRPTPVERLLYTKDCEWQSLFRLLEECRLIEVAPKLADCFLDFQWCLLEGGGRV